jgi:predicted 3-demethylubiquinone-9 3-methyltransferase (glyoxalase superfamily)
LLELLVPAANRKPDGMFFLQSRTSRAKGHAMAKNTICLWYDKDAKAAARFYAETFPDSAIGAVHRAPSDYPSGKQGDVLVVEFTVAGIIIVCPVILPAAGTEFAVVASEKRYPCDTQSPMNQNKIVG